MRRYLTNHTYHRCYSQLYRSAAGFSSLSRRNQTQTLLSAETTATAAVGLFFSSQSNAAATATADDGASETQTFQEMQHPQHQDQPTPSNTSTTEEEAPPLLVRKRLDVAIVGLPNAGKSQILNNLTNSPVSAVSRKRHTTRAGVLGARTVISEDKQKGTQLVFVDTPGFLRFQSARQEGLERQLVVSAGSAMQQVDYTLVVVDAARVLESKDDYKETLATLLMQSLQTTGRREWSDEFNDLITIPPYQDRDNNKEDGISSKAKFGFILNKVDLVNPKNLLLDKAYILQAMAETCIHYHMAVKKGLIPLDNDGRGKNNQEGKFSLQRAQEIQKQFELKQAGRLELVKQMPQFFYTDAKKGEGISDVLEILLKLATVTENAWPMDAKQSSNLTTLERIEEIIREKVYRCLHREVPHQIDQVNQVFRIGQDEDNDETTNGNGEGKTKKTALIHQTLVVYTKSHAQLVQGTNGRTLAKIRDTAIRDLQTMLQCDVVNLLLTVKLNTSKSERGRK